MWKVRFMVMWLCGCSPWKSKLVLKSFTKPVSNQHGHLVRFDGKGVFVWGNIYLLFVHFKWSIYDKWCTSKCHILLVVTHFKTREDVALFVSLKYCRWFMETFLNERWGRAWNICYHLGKCGFQIIVVSEVCVLGRWIQSNCIPAEQHKHVSEVKCFSEESKFAKSLSVLHFRNMLWTSAVHILNMSLRSLKLHKELFTCVFTVQWSSTLYVESELKKQTLLWSTTSLKLRHKFHTALNNTINKCGADKMNCSRDMTKNTQTEVRGIRREIVPWKLQANQITL